MRRTLIAANWKMNGSRSSGAALAGEIAGRAGAPGSPDCDIVICPPGPLLPAVGDALGAGPVALGGQDCHAEASGAFTGDTAAALLADVGCNYVIVGHSERRQGHGEDDATVRAKSLAALAAGLVPIVCIGETEAERDAGEALEGDRPATGGLAARRGRPAGGRLRAGLGHRHRQGRHAGRRGRGPMATSAPA